MSDPDNRFNNAHRVDPPTLDKTPAEKSKETKAYRKAVKEGEENFSLDEDKVQNIEDALNPAAAEKRKDVEMLRDMLKTRNDKDLFSFGTMIADKLSGKLGDGSQTYEFGGPELTQQMIEMLSRRTPVELVQYARALGAEESSRKAQKDLDITPEQDVLNKESEADETLKSVLKSRAKEMGLERMVEMPNSDTLLNDTISVLRRMSPEELQGMGISQGSLDHINPTDTFKPEIVTQAITRKSQEIKQARQESEGQRREQRKGEIEAQLADIRVNGRGTMSAAEHRALMGEYMDVGGDFKKENGNLGWQNRLTEKMQAEAGTPASEATVELPTMPEQAQAPTAPKTPELSDQAERLNAIRDAYNIREKTIEIKGSKFKKLLTGVVLPLTIGVVAAEITRHMGLDLKHAFPVVHEWARTFITPEAVHAAVTAAPAVADMHGPALSVTEFASRFSDIPPEAFKGIFTSDFIPAPNGNIWNYIEGALRHAGLPYVDAQIDFFKDQLGNLSPDEVRSVLHISSGDPSVVQPGEHIDLSFLNKVVGLEKL
jgi:hypothetical protein